MKRLSTPKSGPSSKVASAPEDTVAYGRTSGAMITEEIDIAIESISQLDETDSSAPVSPKDTPIGSSDDGGSSAEKKKSEVVTQRQTYDEKYGYNKLIKRNVESHPLGFPMLSAFQNSGDSVAIFRRFGDTHARLLLRLEVEITSLEEQLASSDRADSENTNTYMRSSRSLQGSADEILLKDSQLRALPTPQSRDFKSFFNWIRTRRPLNPGQDNFAFHQEDFVCSVSTPRTGFDLVITSCLSRWPEWSPLKRLFKRKSKQEQGGKEKDVHVFSSQKIEFWARIVLVCVASTILLIPIFLLYLLELSDTLAAATALIFVLAFATMISILTEGKVDTVFVGTSTYAAVLVTFLGNIRGRA
ncbi:hypothetical protein HYALB_00013488 [Hymenoscyphus albidus]|uniref:DUF6594 domain-containing protein n=1 Tax=Hymenoscyphus albidus TaxID=595503 RepID=A0A9N9LR26_9HELO|nr:hypothetical protein HYALB_00013488 [Hymenoscyphus albidus]